GASGSRGRRRSLPGPAARGDVPGGRGRQPPAGGLDVLRPRSTDSAVEGGPVPLLGGRHPRLRPARAPELPFWYSPATHAAPLCDRPRPACPAGEGVRQLNHRARLRSWLGSGLAPHPGVALAEVVADIP